MKKFLATRPDGTVSEHLRLTDAEDACRDTGGYVTCNCHPGFNISDIRKKES